MKYRIILVKNKRKNKTLFKTQFFNKATEKFIELKNNNLKEIDLPQKHTNQKGIVPVKFELLLLKSREEGDVNRQVRNELGKLIEEEHNSDNWSIVDAVPYNVEETFWVYGYDSRLDRFTIRDIIKRIIVKGIRTRNMTKQIIVVKNKLVIMGDDFDFIICKCQEDCMRLHNKLKQIAYNSKVTKLLFLGVASDATCVDMYNRIQEKTGWNRTKIWRTTTRP